MGRSMCGHLLKAGHQVSVYTRTREKASELLAAGASWSQSPKDVAHKSNVVFTMVGFPSDVEEVYLGADGILAGVAPGSVLCDMTTSEPSLAQRIHDNW